MFFNLMPQMYKIVSVIEGINLFLCNVIRGYLLL